MLQLGRGLPLGVCVCLVCARVWPFVCVTVEIHMCFDSMWSACVWPYGCPSAACVWLWSPISLHVV